VHCTSRNNYTSRYQRLLSWCALFCSGHCVNLFIVRIVLLALCQIGDVSWIIPQTFLRDIFSSSTIPDGDFASVHSSLYITRIHCAQSVFVRLRGRIFLMGLISGTVSTLYLLLHTVSKLCVISTVSKLAEKVCLCLVPNFRRSATEQPCTYVFSLVRFRRIILC
jgi:hypothetical protein